MDFAGFSGVKEVEGRWQQIEKFGSVEEVKVWTTVLTV